MHLTPFYLIALALVGIGDTFYLAYNEFLNTAPSCLLAGCDVVLAHPLSDLLGVPLAYWGLVYYTTLLALVVMLALKPLSLMLVRGVLLYTGVGLLFSTWFIYIQAVIIGAFCQYCMVSAILTVGLLAVAVWHWRSTSNSAGASS
jgi:uncharacterized membrane protein